MNSQNNDDFEFIETDTDNAENSITADKTDAVHAEDNPVDVTDNDSEVELVDLEETGHASSRSVESVMYGNSGYHTHHKHHSHHGRHRHGSHRKKKHRGKKIALAIIGVLVLIIIIAAAVFMIMSSKGKKELLNYESVSVEAPEELEVDTGEDGQTVTYNGKTYVFNDELATIVFIGVDKSELGTEVYGEAGQADAVYIYAYDTSEKESKIICVSRETMVDVNIYSTSGNDAGIENMQLCLSYAYGDGKESSCENTLKSLSRIFYNIPFNSYVALDWDAVAALNDAVGGVEVTVLEDVYDMKKGSTITLFGENAFHYVQYRDVSYLESNSARLDRQKQYITNFANKVISATKSDLTVPLDLYNIAADYMVTNVTANQVSYIAMELVSSVGSMSDIEFLSIEGETIQGEEHAEFYPDEQALYELILDVFYTEKN